MNDEKQKNPLGANIASYRKRMGLTQVGLAEKLNYSDKAVSKWERGESMPDVLTLTQLAELFGITVNDLLADPDALPENPGKVEQVMTKAVEKATRKKANKRNIIGLAALLVWFVAVLLFVVLSSLDIPKSWLAFLYAIPADGIVRLCLRSAWRDYRYNQLLISQIMWGTLIALYVTLLLLLGKNVWSLFLLAIPGQLAIFLAHRLGKKEETNG